MCEALLGETPRMEITHCRQACTEEAQSKADPLYRVGIKKQLSRPRQMDTQQTKTNYPPRPHFNVAQGL